MGRTEFSTKRSKAVSDAFKRAQVSPDVSHVDYEACAECKA